MSEYWIERREAGHPRYRVWWKGPTFAAMVLPDTCGDRTETRCKGTFWTRRGAERYIASVTWKRIDRGATSKEDRA